MSVESNKNIENMDFGFVAKRQLVATEIRPHLTSVDRNPIYSISICGSPRHEYR